MNALTNLESAALRSIILETPDLAADLGRQMEGATVTKRENSGAGFLTYVAVPGDAPQVDAPGVLGHETHARVQGVEHGLGFVLLMREGRMHMLEGYACGSGSTASLDLLDLTFEVFKAPARHAG